MTMKATTSRALVAEMRETVGAQMVLIRELSTQLQAIDRRIRSLEDRSAVTFDHDIEPRRAVDPDPHLGRF